MSFDDKLAFWTMTAYAFALGIGVGWGIGSYFAAR